MLNGKDAIRYTIDTSRDEPEGASLIGNVLGSNGFVKDTAWVNAQGCPLRFVLDVQQHYGDGTLHKEHDEADATQPQRRFRFADDSYLSALGQSIGLWGLC